MIALFAFWMWAHQAKAQRIVVDCTNPRVYCFGPKPADPHRCYSGQYPCIINNQMLQEEREARFRYGVSLDFAPWKP